MCKISHVFIYAGLEQLLTSYQQSYPQELVTQHNVYINQALSLDFSKIA
jgi:hypothetical protein